MRCVYTAALSGSNSQRGFGRQIQPSGSGPGGYAAPNNTYQSAPGPFGISRNGQYYARENDENIKKNIDQYGSGFRSSDQYNQQYYGGGASPYQPYGPYSAQPDMNPPFQDHRYGYRGNSNQYPPNGSSGAYRSRSTDQSTNNQNYNHNHAYHYHTSAYYPYVVDPKYLVPFNRRNYTYQRQHDRLRFEEYFQSSSSSSAPPSRSSSAASLPSGHSDQHSKNLLPPTITTAEALTSAPNPFLGFHASVSIQDQVRKKLSGSGSLIPSVKMSPNQRDAEKVTSTKDVSSLSIAPMEPQDVS